MAIDEAFQHRRHVIAFKPEAAQDFLRDGVRHVLGLVAWLTFKAEHDVEPQQIEPVLVEVIG